MGVGSVTCRETFARNDESRCVGAEVEEELGDDIESQDCVVRKLVVSEAKDTEEHCLEDCQIMDTGERRMGYIEAYQDEEPSELNGLAADCVDCGDCNPVTGDGSCENNDQVADSSVQELLVNC